MNRIVKIVAVIFIISLWPMLILVNKATAHAPIPKLGLAAKITPLSDIKLSSVDVDIKEKHVSIKGSYPQLTSEEKKAKQFNKFVKEQVDSQIAKFRKEIKANEQYTQDIPEKLRDNTYTFSYDSHILQFNDQQVISILFKSEGMIAGSAHPSHPYWSVNFDLTNGKRLMLATVFKPDADYLQKLSSASHSMITDEFKKAKYEFDPSWLSEGTAPKVGNFSVWNMTDKGLQITFPEYQVAPYSMGVQTILIPYV